MKKPPGSGELNQHIQIMISGDADDGAGGSIPGEVLYWGTYAKVDILKSQRSLQANQEKLKPAASFVIRNRSDKFLTEEMVIIWRGERFNIVSADPDYTYKEWLVVIAKSEELPKQ